MKGAQVGATESGNNWLGYIMHHVRHRRLAVQPTVELAKRFSRQRIDPPLEETPALRERVARRPSRDSGNTSCRRNSRRHPGADGANSAVGLRSMTRGSCSSTRSTPIPATSPGEAIRLRWPRPAPRTFGWRRKAFLVSTPTIAGAAASSGSTASDQRRSSCRARHCGEMQWLRFDRLLWEKGAPETARYHCTPATIRCRSTTKRPC
jgi:phage terminase large subunit GpA-like protein